MAVVGDDPDAQLTDLKSGKPVAALKGHLDYSFAAAWHPDGNLLATGNQVPALCVTLNLPLTLHVEGEPR